VCSSDLAEVSVYSAGSAPSRVRAQAIAVMAEDGIDITAQWSKGLDDVPMDRMDVVVTLCAEEECPLFPQEVRVLRWPLPDPGESEGLDGFRAARDTLRERLPSLWDQSLALDA
jgi:arsenate reductase